MQTQTDHKAGYIISSWDLCLCFLQLKRRAHLEQRYENRGMKIHALASSCVENAGFLLLVWLVRICQCYLVDFSTALWWFCRCLCIMWVLAAVYSTIFSQWLHTVRLLSVTLSLFIVCFSTVYPKCRHTNNLKWWGHLLCEFNAKLRHAGCCSVSVMSWYHKTSFHLHEKYCHILIS